MPPIRKIDARPQLVIAERGAFDLDRLIQWNSLGQLNLIDFHIFLVREHRPPAAGNNIAALAKR